jgi:hypothetical protein
MRVGDAANIFVMLNTGGFLAMVIGNSLGVWDVTSASFERDGFCIFNPESSTTSSHLLCFYVDTVSGERRQEYLSLHNSNFV